VVVTAGPTREHLDDVRYLSNGSTGAMGVALARAARTLGSRVTLVLGPTALTPPRGVACVRVTSADEMLAATRRAVRGADLVFFAAAPADWKPVRRRPGKPPKGNARALRLVPTPDIAATLGRTKGRRIHVGFALESGHGGEERAREKLRTKRFDAIVLNSPANLGRGGGRVAWIGTDGRAVPLPSSSKARLSRVLVRRAWPRGE
jgi:phosphopantothenoylcysteine decarboxylase/phosphopantothenate--cysteine ligase